MIISKYVHKQYLQKKNSKNCREHIKIKFTPMHTQSAIADFFRENNSYINEQYILLVALITIFIAS